jgi:ribonuclease BN (tRNA processing enzyme)
MRLRILGSCGAWPGPGQACSGYLVEHDGFRLLIDLGYATVPKLLEQMNADEVDAVFISHGHPDHCADLNPLLRARALRDDPPAPLPLYALPGALDAVLALDRPGMLEAAYVLHEISAGSRLDIGRFAPRLACCRTRCQMLGYGWLREVGCSRTPVTPARAQT